MVWANFETEETEEICIHRLRSTFEILEPPPMQGQALRHSSFLEVKSNLTIESRPAPVRLTSIICTLGSHSRDLNSLEKLMAAGVNIIRTNVSHGTQDIHAELIRDIRTAADNYGKKIGYPFPIAIGIDTKGPEIRTGFLEGGIDAEVEVKRGNTIKVTTDPAYMTKCSTQVVYIDYENILKVVKIGTMIYIDDGLVILTCQSISGVFLTCSIEFDGILGSNKPVNLPGADLELPIVSERDKSDLKFAVAQDVDFIFASYTSTPESVQEIRDILGKRGRNMKIIAKVESLKALQNIEALAKVSDGIMIARGDLGIEITVEKLFLGQKKICAACSILEKPVVCSREYIESMIQSSIPSRPDVCDVANAIIDGTDCIALTRETAKAQNPVEVIQMTSKICKEAEACQLYNETTTTYFKSDLIKMDPLHILCLSAVHASITCLAGAIFCFTDTGHTAYILSRFHPRCPIVAITRNVHTARIVHLYRGIIPFLYKEKPLDNPFKEVDKQINSGIEFAQHFGFLRSGDAVIVITDLKRGLKQLNHCMIILYVKEKLEVHNDVLYIR